MAPGLGVGPKIPTIQTLWLPVQLCAPFSAQGALKWIIYALTLLPTHAGPCFLILKHFEPQRLFAFFLHLSLLEVTKT